MSNDGSLLLNPLTIKGISSFIIASAVDKYIFGETDMKHNLVFGASTSAGIVVGSIIGAQIPSVIEDSTFFNGKTVMQRSFELAFGAGASYGAFAYSGFNYTPSDSYKRFGAVLATDFISEYCADFMTSQPLQYFN
jgi:hypothetical protein